MNKVLQLFIVLAFLGLSTKMNAQIVNIPDAHFYYALIDWGVQDSADYITVNSAKAFEGELNVSNWGITDLTGIQAFTAITSLICDSNSLTNLDLSSNTVLNYLSCYHNQLTSLDVSPNAALNTLECGRNRLTSLNLSSNAALNYLNCDNNSLTNLNVLSDTALVSLSCGFNKLTSLNLSSKIALTYLNCYYNYLTSLDVSSDTALTIFYCSSDSLTSLDVSSNTALTFLSCDGNKLTSLDVSSNTALTVLECAYNSLTSLNLSSNTSLFYLDCIYNNLKGLNLSSNTSLNSLYCYSNNLTNLDVKNGNNHNMDSSRFDATHNDSLTCIEVDTVAYSTANWHGIDAWAHFSTNCNYPNAVNEIAAIADVSIYPNPATDKIYIKNQLGNKSQVTLFNVMGEMMFSLSPREGWDGVIDVSPFSSGVYFIRLANEKESWVGRFVKE